MKITKTYNKERGDFPYNVFRYKHKNVSFRCRLWENNKGDVLVTENNKTIAYVREDASIDEWIRSLEQDIKTKTQLVEFLNELKIKNTFDQ
jgi:hypothetical protein